MSTRRYVIEITSRDADRIDAEAADGHLLMLRSGRYSARVLEIGAAPAGWAEPGEARCPVSRGRHAREVSRS
jgi:hypothetical protein